MIISDDVFNNIVKPFLIPDRKRIFNAFRNYIHKFLTLYGMASADISDKDSDTSHIYMNYNGILICYINLHKINDYSINIYFTYRSAHFLTMSLNLNNDKEKIDKKLNALQELMIEMREIENKIKEIQNKRSDYYTDNCYKKMNIYKDYIIKNPVLNKIIFDSFFFYNINTSFIDYYRNYIKNQQLNFNVCEKIIFNNIYE